MVSLALRSSFQFDSLISTGGAKAKYRTSVRLKRLQAPKAVAGSSFDLKQHLNSFKDAGRLNLAGIGAAAVLYAYSRLKPSPCEMLLRGGPAAHFFSLAEDVPDGKYLPRKDDARRLYEKIQKANRSYVIVHAPCGLGKTELLKEMCRTIKSGVLYSIHTGTLNRTLSAVYWELGCYVRSVLTSVLNVIKAIFFPESLCEVILEKQCEDVFGRNGLLFRASQEYRKRTGKRVLCILDNIPDGNQWDSLVEPLKQILVKDSPFCLVFVCFGNPGCDHSIAYDPPTKEELEAFLSQNYKLTPEITKEIVNTGKYVDIDDFKSLAQCYEEEGEEMFWSLQEELHVPRGIYRKPMFLEFLKPDCLNSFGPG